MQKVVGKHALFTLFAGLIFSAGYASAQDLGSSSGIFRSPNEATKKHHSSSPTNGSQPKIPIVKKPTPKTTAKGDLDNRIVDSFVHRDIFDSVMII